MHTTLVFHGTLAHSVSPTELKILENALMVVDQKSGKIIVLEQDISRSQVPQRLTSLGIDESLGSKSQRFLRKGELLIPGFVDTHNHAPQWAQRGLGRGLEILDWLEAITFKNEAKFSDVGHARRIYTRCVNGFLQQGITTVSYYGSLHGEATKILAEICLEKGQRAFIGKCNMNQNSPEWYRDADAADSLKLTEEVINHVRALDPSFNLIRPILTPRFAICCDRELLKGLGDIAKKEPSLPIQTHFNEAASEIAATLGLFPEFQNEVDLYNHFDLLTQRSILAHCTHMTDYEITKVKELGCGIAHCPISNTTVGGGFMAASIRKFFTQGILKIGLGTDSGGGFSSSILDAMKQAFIVSNAREMMSKGEEKNLSLEECFYLATLGGARVCCLDDKIGNFEVGKEFDASIVTTLDDEGETVGVMTMVERDEDSSHTILEKFLMSGDDRNISEVFVRGRQLKGTSRHAD